MTSDFNFRKDDIVFLLGAGCSADAGFLTSTDMINDLENLIRGKSDKRDDVNWTEFQHLYYCVKSSIMYGDGMKGEFGDGTSINIERLVNTLTALEKRDDHALSPFIANWNMNLEKILSGNSRLINEFKKAILRKLRTWVTSRNYEKSDYYSRLFGFKSAFQFPLRVFTLNYDLCVEVNCRKSNLENGYLERGFDENRNWVWGRFEDSDKPWIGIYLYKMHGSIDWEKDENGSLTFSDDTGNVTDPHLIFGTDYKLQYIDPYLFFASEFRRYTLQSKIIVSLGYGFGDEHINEMIGQSLRADCKRILLFVTKASNVKNDISKRQTLQKDIKRKVKEALHITTDTQILLDDTGAEKFMREKLTREDLSAILPPEDNALKFDS
ncbi:MAG: SIR2 family protein [Chloroflexi bacterium]|nr:SIR2 family protein [Chloroflexota bacterium]